MLALRKTPKEVKRLLKINSSICETTSKVDSECFLDLLVDCSHLMKFEKIVLKILTQEQITTLEDTLMKREVPILWTPQKRTPKTP